MTRRTRIPAFPARQHGGAIGMLLSLLIVGALLYLVLRPGKPGQPANQASMISCEQRVSKLMSTTGGVGEKAKAAYDALPAECRKMMPDPAALAPSPERSSEGI